MTNKNNNNSSSSNSSSSGSNGNTSSSNSSSSSSSSEEKTPNELDSITKQLGDFGRYQTIIFLLICIPVCFNAIFSLAYVFTTSSIQQRCKISECDTSESIYLERWVNYSIPHDENGVPSKCTRFAPIHNIGELYKDNKCSKEKFNKDVIEECDEFIYKTTEKSIANEWNISCPNNAWKLSLIGTINNIGQFIGMPLGGYISDRYGRRVALATGGTISAIMGIIKSLSINYEMFASFEFLDAAVGCVIYSTAWIIGVELVGQKRRALACSLLSIFYAFGEVILGIVAKYVQYWRHLIRFLYIPALIHVLYFWILPESIRWLLSQHKTEKAISLLQKAAKFNGTVLTEESLQNLRAAQNSSSENASKNEKYPFMAAFKSPKLLWRIINCSFCWFANTLVYYGLSLNSVSLAGDKYVNFILACLIEIPAFVLSSIIMDKIGRRWSLCGSLLVSGVMCALAIFVQANSDDKQWWSLIVYLIGKFAITVSFTVLYVYTAEIFPTNIRQSLLSVCSMFGRIGSMIAPQTVLMAQNYTFLPLILFSTCATLSGILTLQFPETASKELPDTIAEAETVERTTVEKAGGETKDV